MEDLDPLNYLIDQEGIDWQSHLRPWMHLLPDSFTIWLVNRFGDLFFVFDDGSLHHLDIQLGTVTKRGNSKKEFLEVLADEQNAQEWLYIHHVDQAEKAGIPLPQGHCYTYKVPPVLSGEYSINNLCTVEIGQNFAFLADIHQQIKDLPDGASVTLDWHED